MTIYLIILTFFHTILSLHLANQTFIQFIFRISDLYTFLCKFIYCNEFTSIFYILTFFSELSLYLIKKKSQNCVIFHTFIFHKFSQNCVYI